MSRNGRLAEHRAGSVAGRGEAEAARMLRLVIPRVVYRCIACCRTSLLDNGEALVGDDMLDFGICVVGDVAADPDRFADAASLGRYGLKPERRRVSATSR